VSPHGSLPIQRYNSGRTTSSSAMATMASSHVQKSNYSNNNPEGTVARMWSWCAVSPHVVAVLVVVVVVGIFVVVGMTAIKSQEGSPVGPDI
jgi:uncharacterized membrane protein